MATVKTVSHPIPPFPPPKGGVGIVGKQMGNPTNPTNSKNGNRGKGQTITDLLGDALPLERKQNARPEAAALVEVLKALESHNAVAWVRRMNSGAAKVGKRFIRFGWPGCPDVLGQLKDGRLLGVEVKAEKGKLRPEQTIFLERIRLAGGVAFMARNYRDVMSELSELTEKLQ